MASMPDPLSTDETCWSLIARAAVGESLAGDQFARRYRPLMEAYFRSRWRSAMELLHLIDDAVQDSFFECFRERGVLSKTDPKAPSGFRAYLRGVLRNVARRYECRIQKYERLEEVVDHIDLDREVDRKFAQTLMAEASLRQQEHAKESGSEALRRIELLELRFREGKPIRDIAEQWNVRAEWLHHQYAMARSEFKRCLMEVLGEHEPSCTHQELQGMCRELLGLL